MKMFYNSFVILERDCKPKGPVGISGMCSIVGPKS